MFLNLFRRTIIRGVGTSKKSLQCVRKFYHSCLRTSPLQWPSIGAISFSVFPRVIQINVANTYVGDELFDAHGAPPKGAATKLANDVKRLQAVNTFPDFLNIMGMEKIPSASQ